MLKIYFRTNVSHFYDRGDTNYLEWRDSLADYANYTRGAACVRFCAVHNKMLRGMQIEGSGSNY